MSRLVSVLRSWFAGFRTREFSLVILAAGALARQLCETVGVPPEKQMYVVLFFIGAIAAAYIANPKYTEWVTEKTGEVPPPVYDPSVAADVLRSLPTKGDYDAVADLLDDYTDPIYRNSADDKGGR